MFQFPPLPEITSLQQRVVFVMAAAFALIEIALQASDYGLLAPDLRWRAYEAFSYFDPWFKAWLRGDPAPDGVLWTLLTHAFLHGGMTHMVMNTGVFLGLGFMTMRVFGALWVLVIFAVTAAAGALCFSLLTGGQAVLVGASGAIFGLLGALKMVEIGFIRRFGGSWRAYWRVIGALVLVNVLLAVGLGGLLAWQAHLGGFLGGMAVAWVFKRVAAPSA